MSLVLRQVSLVRTCGMCMYAYMCGGTWTQQGSGFVDCFTFNSGLQLHSMWPLPVLTASFSLLEGGQSLICHSIKQTLVHS